MLLFFLSSLAAGTLNNVFKRNNLHRETGNQLNAANANEKAAIMIEANSIKASHCPSLTLLRAAVRLIAKTQTPITAFPVRRVINDGLLSFFPIKM